MAVPKLVMPEYVSLKDHPDINEDWLQERLAENPELLGLGGDLVARDRGRSQPGGGQLDLLLEDVDADIRYEVEIQLGALDESHIIRTIEHWDVERRRYPEYEHIVVIVSEKDTGRFHNVISLLNSDRMIPLIAIQIQGLTVEGGITLVATRVVDLPPPAEEDELKVGRRTSINLDKRYSQRNKLHGRLLQDYGAFCQGCGADYNFDPRVLVADHIRPKSDGGNDDYDNRTLLCPPCNGKKGDRLTLTGLQKQNRQERHLLPENEHNLRIGSPAMRSGIQYLKERDEREQYLKIRERFFGEREEAHVDDLVEFIREEWHTTDEEIDSAISGCIEVMHLDIFPMCDGYHVRRKE